MPLQKQEAKKAVSEMILLFYEASENVAGERLEKVLKDLLPHEDLEVYGTMDGFSRRLRQHLGTRTIAVLLAATKEELSQILSIRDLLHSVRIVLILPDRGEETVAKGHGLWPRFLTSVDSDFTDVAAVLGRMLERSRYQYKKQ